MTISIVIYNFVNFIQTNVRIGNGRESTLELLIQGTEIEHQNRTYYFETR